MKINYPDDWLGPESIGALMNYSELMKFCKANGLNSGHLSYILDKVEMCVLGTVNRMLEEAEGLSSERQTPARASTTLPKETQGGKTL